MLVGILIAAVPGAILDLPKIGCSPPSRLFNINPNFHAQYHTKRKYIFISVVGHEPTNTDV